MQIEISCAREQHCFLFGEENTTHNLIIPRGNVTFAFVELCHLSSGKIYYVPYLIIQLKVQVLMWCY